MATELQMTNLSRSDLSTQLVEIIQDMMSDWDSDFEGSMDLETKLIADLGFESIDVVQLIVAIETHFDRRDLPFEELLMRDGRYVEDLSVGETARFLEAHL